MGESQFQKDIEKQAKWIKELYEEYLNGYEDGHKAGYAECIEDGRW